MLRAYIISIHNVTIAHLKEFVNFVIIHLRVKNQRYQYIIGSKT